MPDANVNFLPDDALVVRGGMNLPENFAQGMGVSADSAGLLRDVSVQCAAGKTPAELARGLPNRQVGVTTVGAVRAAGGQVVPAPTRGNSDHCVLQGLDAQTASRLFTPTVRNPNRVK